MADNRNEPPKSPGDFDFFANFDEHADEMEKEFEEGIRPEEELEKNTDFDNESLKNFNFFNDENEEEENPEKAGKNDVDKPEENDKEYSKEDALGEDEELVREREYDYGQYAGGTNSPDSEEFDVPEEEIDEKAGSAADVDEEVAAIDEKWLEDQKKAKQMAKDEADKRIREIYERAHRHTQHASQNQSATGMPSGVEAANQESSAPEIETAADYMLDKQSLPESENIDDTEANPALNEEGDSNTFEMERERVPDYNQWRTAPRSDNTVEEEATSPTVTGAEGISQEAKSDTFKSSAANMLKRQGVPGTSDAAETLDKIDDLEAEIEDVTSPAAFNSRDARKEGDSNAFEMERERVPDYNQWRTAPRSDNTVEEEEATSPAVTGAEGISQEAKSNTFKSSAANMLKKQGVPGASDAAGGTAGTIQQADAAKNAAKSVTSGASSIGSGIASSTARNSNNVDEERNKQAKSVQSAAKSSVGALGYLNSKDNAMPTRERDSSPSGSVTGASGISEAPKEDTAAGGWQYPGLDNDKPSAKPAEPVNGKERHNAEYVRSHEKGPYSQMAPTRHNSVTQAAPISPSASVTGASGIQDASKTASDAVKTAKKTTDVLQKGAKVNALTGAAGAVNVAGAALLHKDSMRPHFGNQEDGGFADVTGTSRKAGIAHADVVHKTEKTDSFVRHLNQNDAGLTGKKKQGGSQAVKVNGKKVSPTGDIEAKGFAKGKAASKDSSFSYDEKTGKVKLGGLKAKDTSVDKHMRGKSETRIIDSDEAVKRSHAVNGKGIAGKKEDIVIKNGDKLKISPHGTINAEQTVTTKENGKIRIGKQGTPGISSSGAVAGIKKAETPGKGPQAGGRQAKERARDSLRTENATSEYLRGSVAKNKAIKLSRDGTISEGRAGELLEAAEESEGGLSRLKTGSSRRTKSTNRAAKSRTAKMNVGRGARAGTGKAGALAASAQDAKKQVRKV